MCILNIFQQLLITENIQIYANTDIEHLVNLLNDNITMFSRIVYHVMQGIVTKAVGVAISRTFYGRSLEVIDEGFDKRK